MACPSVGPHLGLPRSPEFAVYPLCGHPAGVDGGLGFGKDSGVTAPVPRERLGSVTRRIGTLQHFRWLRGIAIAIIVLNVFDAVLTLLWIRMGTATEANPILAELAHNNPALFLTVKFSLVGLGSLLLWRFRKRKSAVVAIFVGFLAYYFLLLYHLNSMKVQILNYFFS